MFSLLHQGVRTPAGTAPDIAVLTAGRDKPYALGLAAALVERGVPFEFIGSDEVDSPELHTNRLVTFLNFRGDQSKGAPIQEKMVRVLRYYGRLLKYAIRARPRVFHILWNNKFEWFDRTILLLFYRLCGRRLVFTAHNVNINQRDGSDSFTNRLTLKIQYALVDDIFVHTEQMKLDLHRGFGVPAEKIHVIPFPMNSTVPNTSMDSSMARLRLGIGQDERVLLTYGAIAPYKGLEYVVEALSRLQKDSIRYRLLIAGGLKKGADQYWQGIEQKILELGLKSDVISRIEYIPDDETEIYFKAADALVLSYTYIFQSGVLFLGYNFGLPVLAADVGSFRESVVESKTGFIFRPKDADDLARAIRQFFVSEIYNERPHSREKIRAFAEQHYSWNSALPRITEVYARLLGRNTQEISYE